MKPVLLYDGECGFCRRWLVRWRFWTGDEVEHAPYQEAVSRFPRLSKSALAEAVHLVEPDGRVSTGAEAVYRSLAVHPGKRWLVRLYERFPPFRLASELAYRLIARHRVAALRVTQLLWGDRLEPPTYRLARWLFIRSVGLIYLIAFVSFWLQLDGLIGPDGILPADPFLASAESRLGASRWRLLPTLCWLGGAGPFLDVLCGAGVASAALVIAGVVQPFALIVAWAAYLSLTVVGLDFMAFQWDNLLLEAGFLAVFYAPLRWRSRLATDPEPPALARLLVLWLLFRLMFQSGLVKLFSGDPTWRAFTALRFHYETQPLPPWSAWYVHQLPASFHRLSTAIMFVIELGLPFLVFLPRLPRMTAAAGLLALQSLIIATGNYCFFNLLALALCIPLVEDSDWPRAPRGPPAFTPASRAKRWALALVAAAVFPIGLVQTLSLFTGWGVWPDPVRRLVSTISPLRTFNNYGLFAVMTTTRPEIVVEGSEDGKDWRAYEFQWKPGDLRRRPRFVAPHQPRLDWQMWFAALGDYRQNPWFVNFLARLLEGSKPVLELLATNPFPEKPPRFVRATVYYYRFTDPSSERAWWRRELRGPYLPVLTRTPEPATR